MPPTNKSPKKKKRKQSAVGGHSSPSSSPRKKKNRTTAPAAPGVALRKVTIQVQKPDAAVDPILVSFPGGVPESVGSNGNSNSNGSSSRNSKPPRFIWRQLNPKAKAGRAVEGQDGSDATTNGTCVYRATSLGMGYDDRRTKVCVGVYDKQTGILKLHQAASRGTVFALQQHLPSYHESMESQSDLNLSRSLFADFGSAKKRKVLKSQQDNKVNVDAVIGAGKAIVDSLLLDDNDGNKDDNDNTTTSTKMSESNRKAVEEARLSVANEDGSNNSNRTPGRNEGVDRVIESAHTKARNKLLPPYDKEAAEVYKVYQFHTIVGPDGWDFVCRMVEACLRNKEGTDFFDAVTRGKPDEEGNIPPPERRGWNPSVLDCLKHATQKGLPEAAQDESLDDGKSESSAKYQLRCIIMYHYLIKFYCHFHKTAKGRGGRIVPGMEEDQPKFMGIPRDAALHMFEAFTTEQLSDRQAPILPPEKRIEGERPRREINPNLPRYIMTKPNKDKCVCHILTLYLVARGGSKMKVDDMSLVFDDINLDAKEAASMLRMAGCAVATTPSTKKTRAALVVPLTFPKPGRGGKR